MTQPVRSGRRRSEPTHAANRRPEHPLKALARTFATGAVAGIAVFVGAAWLRPEAATIAFDWLGDGLGAVDALVPAWLLGHVAVLIEHILPEFMRE